jgi:hypothetical protein
VLSLAALGIVLAILPAAASGEGLEAAMAAACALS